MNAPLADGTQRGLSRAKWLLVFILCASAAWLALRYVRIGINETSSLKHRVFLVIRGSIPTERGEYVVFRWAGQGGYYRRGVLFTKLIAGVPGERIEVFPDRLVTVSGRTVGYARPRSSSGKVLEPAEPGVIPPGYLFVAGESEMSLDSRYKLVGLVRQQDIVGTAYAIF